MTAAEKLKWTEKQYLEFERASQEKHDFLNGEIYAMAGASVNHIRISGNIDRTLGLQLQDRDCDVLALDMRVKVSITGLYTYPDVVAVCGALLLDDDEIRDTLLNPNVIIEVLSPNYDRGKKFEHYRTLKTLCEYVLVAQDRAYVEYYTLQTDERWLYSAASGLDAIIELTSIDCKLALADLYRRVTFEEEAS